MKLEKGTISRPVPKSPIRPCCMCALCVALCYSADNSLREGLTRQSLTRSPERCPGGQQGERLWIPPHVYPQVLLLLPFEKRKDFRYHWPYAAVTPTSFPASLSLLRPVDFSYSTSLVKLRSRITWCMSSALSHPRWFFFSMPSATPTIELVTDDKQIHLSNSICARSFFFVVHFLSSPGYPQPEYRWMKDGSFQTEFSSEPVYKIQSIRREDAGVYQCVARNAVGSIFSEQVQVLVACTSHTTIYKDQTVNIVFINFFCLLLVFVVCTRHESF